MEPNPALGVLIFALGGLAGALFCMPFKKVRNWAWESYWMVYAVVGLLIVPWILAFCTSPNVLTVLRNSPPKTIGYCFACGAMWGFGGFTWGLMVRYLGVGLGTTIGCGLCSASGTIVPTIIGGTLATIAATNSGKASLASVAVSLIGIMLVGMAGMSKERELPEEQKKKSVAEYNFAKGLAIAIFSGLMSSAMNYGLQGGKCIEELALSTAPVTSATWKGMPVLVVVLMGGFVVNFLYCLFLNLKNKTAGDYTKPGAPLVGNLFFAALAGAIWTSQFVSLKTGEPAMGSTAYIGFAVLMAAAILFSTLLGVLLGEWKGTTPRTRVLLAAGLALLVLSAVIAGYSGYLKAA